MATLNTILHFPQPPSPPKRVKKGKKSKACPYCGEEVLAVASKCKHCGSDLKPKKKGKPTSTESEKTSAVRRRCGCLALVVIVVAVVINMFDFDESNSPASPKTPEEIRQNQLFQDGFIWDGAHRGLTAVIKESMNDPKSYEHVKTEYSDNGDHLIVETTFRGKNAFGGTVVSSVTAKTDLQGNVIEVISRTP